MLNLAFFFIYIAFLYFYCTTYTVYFHVLYAIYPIFLCLAHKCAFLQIQTGYLRKTLGASPTRLLKALEKVVTF